MLHYTRSQNARSTYSTILMYENEFHFKKKKTPRHFFRLSSFKLIALADIHQNVQYLSPGTANHTNHRRANIKYSETFINPFKTRCFFSVVSYCWPSTWFFSSSSSSLKCTYSRLIYVQTYFTCALPLLCSRVLCCVRALLLTCVSTGLL